MFVKWIFFYINCFKSVCNHLIYIYPQYFRKAHCEVMDHSIVLMQSHHSARTCSNCVMEEVCSKQCLLPAEGHFGALSAEYRAVRITAGKEGGVMQIISGWGGGDDLQARKTRTKRWNEETIKSMKYQLQYSTPQSFCVRDLKWK